MYVKEYLKFISNLYKGDIINFNKIIEQTGLNNVQDKKI